MSQLSATTCRVQVVAESLGFFLFVAGLGGLGAAGLARPGVGV